MCDDRRRPTVLVSAATMNTAELAKLYAFSNDLSINCANVVQYSLTRDGPDLRRWVQAHLAEADVFCFTYQPYLAVDRELLSHATPNKLKGLVTMSVGHDNVDLDECKRRRLRVGFGALALTEVTAERAVALLLATACRIPEACVAAREGRWPQATGQLNALNGKEVGGSVVGLFGMGRIGRAIADRLRPFNPRRILYNCRQPKAELSYEFVSFDELLENSDFLISIAEANTQTARIFDREAFAKMKPEAIFINFSRGSLVCTDALTEALSSGKIWAAGLDVTDPEPLPVGHPLYAAKNCVLLPHIGSATDTAHRRVYELAVENIRALLTDQPMPCPLLDYNP